MVKCKSIIVLLISLYIFEINCQSPTPTVATTRTTPKRTTAHITPKRIIVHGFEMICVDPIAQCTCRLCIDIEFNGVGASIVWKPMNRASVSQHWQWQGNRLVNRLNNLVMTAHTNRAITLETRLPGEDNRQKWSYDYRHVGRGHSRMIATFLNKPGVFPHLYIDSQQKGGNPVGTKLVLGEAVTNYDDQYYTLLEVL